MNLLTEGSVSPDKARFVYYGGYPIFLEVSNMLFNITYDDSFIMAKNNSSVLEIKEVSLNECVEENLLEAFFIVNEISSPMVQGLSNAFTGGGERLGKKFSSAFQKAKDVASKAGKYAKDVGKNIAADYKAGIEQSEILTRIGNELEKKTNEILKKARSGEEVTKMKDSFVIGTMQNPIKMQIPISPDNKITLHLTLTGLVDDKNKFAQRPAKKPSIHHYDTRTDLNLDPTIQGPRFNLPGQANLK